MTVEQVSHTFLVADFIDALALFVALDPVVVCLIGAAWLIGIYLHLFGLPQRPAAPSNAVVSLEVAQRDLQRRQQLRAMAQTPRTQGKDVA